MCNKIDSDQFQEPVQNGFKFFLFLLLHFIFYHKHYVFFLHLADIVIRYQCVTSTQELFIIYNTWI